MLPGMNGYKVCATLREEGIWTPILMLTAKDGEWDEVEALDTGADDFLTKPFSHAVLVARLRALLRRGARERPTVLEAGDLRLDPAAKRAWRGDTEIDLTAREIALLEFLMRRRGEVVSKREILDHVWDYDFEGDPNIVEVYVRHLRNKLDRPFGRNAIETRPRVGIPARPPTVADTVRLTGDAGGPASGTVRVRTTVAAVVDRRRRARRRRDRARHRAPRHADRRRFEARRELRAPTISPSALESGTTPRELTDDPRRRPVWSRYSTTDGDVIAASPDSHEAGEPVVSRVGTAEIGVRDEQDDETDKFLAAATTVGHCRGWPRTVVVARTLDPVTDSTELVAQLAAHRAAAAPPRGRGDDVDARRPRARAGRSDAPRRSTRSPRPRSTAGCRNPAAATRSPGSRAR